MEDRPVNNQSKIVVFKQLIYETLSEIVNDDYSLLDIPFHGNIGDSLITQGELDFLRELPFSLLFKSNLDCELEKIPKNGIILFNGGGNFGDFWPGSNEFRRKVIIERKNQRIIIFPQSVYYGNEGNLILDVQAFDCHPDLTICARDNESYNFLKMHFKNTKIFLLPDMAFYIDIKRFFKANLSEIQISEKRASRKALLLYRNDREANFLITDIERVLHDRYSGTKFDVSDWPTLPDSLPRSNLFKLIQKVKKLIFLSAGKRLSDSNGRGKTDKSRFNMEMCKQGIELFSCYDQIFSTRLHGVILGIMMDKDVIAFDNSYGKVSAFVNTWLTGFDRCSLVIK